MSADIRRALIVGGGHMGRRIALRCALSGIVVTVCDIDPEAERKAQPDYERLARLLHKRDAVDPDDFRTSAGQIRWTTDFRHAAEEADFISENIPEDIGSKQQIWKALSAHVRSDCLLTTNTSYLLPSMFAEASRYPQQFCAFHFHDVFTACVVDVMPHATTNPTVVSALIELGKKLHQIPVYISKESAGYIFNRLFAVNLFTAGILIARGAASPEDVDRSWMGNFRMPIGPCGMMDEVGLDTVWHVGRYVPLADKNEFLDYLQRHFIERGKLGVKSGEGFYTYPNAAYKAPNFLSRDPHRETKMIIS